MPNANVNGSAANDLTAAAAVLAANANKTRANGAQKPATPPAAPPPAQETAEQELARLRAENERLKAAAAKSRTGQLSLRVSEKGALSVYGLGRFPVTLYKEQWIKLFGFGKEIGAFMKEHESDLKTKE